ncbi:hypothetical protein KQX54_017850 [Cotesia glomerata]|uniref:Uncharacterized protein n=1 Tax=Cotesia glomerata TaxID=32391 RepID=A0AAV7HYT6_COTGL|nr:hypothetical protein KQX54_017850 [Cotesia glomerata]
MIEITTQYVNLSSLEEKSDDSDESMDLTTTKRKRKKYLIMQAHLKQAHEKCLIQDVFSSATQAKILSTA